jgi:aspartate/methionine/tyrosine aminotransferase
MIFSKISQSLGPASSILLNERVYELKRNGKNPIILSYGEAPFDMSGIDFSGIDMNRGAHYSESRGVPDFLDALKEYYFQQHGVKINQSANLMVTCGSKIGCYIALSSILNAGDSILLHEPSWVSYREHAKLCGASTSFIPYNISPLDFEKYINKCGNIKALILNNPNNPRGYVYNKDELIFLANLCKKKGLFLVLDESYSEYVTDNIFFTGANLISEYENVIVLNSISKNFGLSGWRVGYVLASKEFINTANSLNQHLITCAPTVLQLYLAKNLSTLHKMSLEKIYELQKKRKNVESILNNLGFEYLSGGATFYFFLDMSSYHINSQEFVLDLLREEGVAIIPGSSYGASTSSFLRLSIGAEPLERIELGLSKVKKFAENL